MELATEDFLAGSRRRTRRDYERGQLIYDDAAIEMAELTIAKSWHSPSPGVTYIAVKAVIIIVTPSRSARQKPRDDAWASHDISRQYEKCSHCLGSQYVRDTRRHYREINDIVKVARQCHRAGDADDAAFASACRRADAITRGATMLV